ncbi:MAG: hypothetical protein ACPG31_13420 [Planctomycetota bacterium]
MTLCLVAFIATTMGIRGLVPERMKVEWYETKKEQADVLFLGSSHVFRQMDPVLFDEIRKVKEGEPRSLNLGTQGMELQEEIYLLKQILTDKPDALRWVILEAQPFLIGLRNENDFGNRRISWHDSETTWRLVKAGYRSTEPPEVRWDLARRHIEHWWRRCLNLGRGMDALEALGVEPLSLFEDQSALGVADNGYLPLEMSTASTRNQQMRQSFRNNPGDMFRGANNLDPNRDTDAPDAELLAVVREVEELAAQKGVTLIWWLHPNLKHYPGWRHMAETQEIQHLIAMDDPQRFSDFYRMPLRFDLYHLNKEGAEMLTEELAREFVHIQREAQTP